jgi:hypothetical protein
VPFTGSANHTYRFYTLAVDNVGNLEAPPLLPDAQTLVAAAPWRNAARPTDVNNNGETSPVDALLVINELIAKIYHSLPNNVLVARTDESLPFYDTSGDGLCTPLDALLVINALFSRGGEGESGSAPIRDAIPIRDAVFADTQWLDDWNLDSQQELRQGNQSRATRLLRKGR